MARGQRSGWRSTRRRRISYGACWPEVFRIYLPSVLRSSGSSPAPHSQVQLISQLIYLTIHLSTYLIIHLTTHLTTDLCCISLSVYLSISFSFLTSLPTSLSLVLWLCISHLVSLYLLFTCRTLLFYDIFSCICFTQIIDGFVYLPFNFSNISYDFSDSCENFSCLPAFNVGKGGGGRLYDCQVWHHWHSLSQNQSHLDGCVPTIWRSLHGQRGAPFVFDPNTCVGDNRTHR